MEKQDVWPEGYLMNLPFEDCHFLNESNLHLQYYSITPRHHKTVAIIIHTKNNKNNWCNTFIAINNVGP